MPDFKKMLKASQASWKKAKERVQENRGQSFAEFDDGKYVAKLIGAEVGQSESSNRLQVDYSWRFEEEPYEGQIKHAYQGLETEDNLFYAGRDLERLGYEMPDDLTELPDVLDAIVKEKIVARINLKSKGDFQNVFIQKVLNNAEDEEEPDDEEVDEDAEEATDEEEETTEETEPDEDESEEESDDGEGDEEGTEEDEEESEEESDEEESGDDDGEEVAIEVGQRVIAETTKGNEPGEIVAVLEEEGKVRVKLDNGKTVRLGPEKIEIELEKKPVPKTPVKATPKPAPKPAAKPVSKPAPKPAAKKTATAKPAPVKAGKKKSRK